MSHLVIPPPLVCASVYAECEWFVFPREAPRADMHPAAAFDWQGDARSSANCANEAPRPCSAL